MREECAASIAFGFGFSGFAFDVLFILRAVAASGASEKA